MLSRDEKLRLKTLISDTVVLLCKNGLVSKLKGEFSIEGLIGISLEENDLMLVSINEKLRGSQPEILNKSEHSSQSESDTDQQNTASSRRKRRKRKNKKSIETVEEASPRKNASVNFRTENSPFHLRHQPSPALVHTDNVAFHHQTNTRQPQPAIIQPVSSTIHHQSPDSKSFNVSSNDHLVQPPQSTSHLQMPYISETSSAVGTIGSTDYLLADNSATGDSFLNTSQLNIKKEHYDSETDTNEELILVKEEGKNQPVMDNNFPVEPQIQHFVANQAALLTGDATAPAHTIVSVPASGPIVADNAQEVSPKIPGIVTSRIIDIPYDDVHFYKSTRGYVKVALYNYTYNLDRQGTSGADFWRCDQRTIHCKGRLKITPEKSVFLIRQHNHPSEVRQIQPLIARVKNEIVDFSELQTELEKKSDIKRIKNHERSKRYRDKVKHNEAFKEKNRQTVRKYRKLMKTNEAWKQHQREQNRIRQQRFRSRKRAEQRK